ncbi:EF-hand domain-containing protein [Streptomyces sp. NBC_00513]|uniref:EF-hand domain-containing protein n=1 Tax=unclassified Streptomyces TaxID=2593676 RepID=UPI00224DE8F6|nr:EF-hand domain-containing protein [Streptomyces sp. NBC_00424]MCX5078605.1 EF-hand domain-containing protein [Streptomyces sp. NBC_00424]WUD39051.1 EF-hand domain-containing protein [Streptomyces sp. NBC_00513]WUD45678.1 EF-hand domain-containing protein [Streptomyces sp. NBC_00513]
MDSKRVNEVSMADFEYLAGVWNFTPPVAWDAFDQLDTDSDGALSRKEFVHSVHEFLSNPDAQAAASGIILGVQ